MEDGYQAAWDPDMDAQRREVNARLIRLGLAPLPPDGMREYHDPRPRHRLGPIGQHPDNPHDE